MIAVKAMAALALTFSRCITYLDWNLASGLCIMAVSNSVRIWREPRRWKPLAAAAAAA